MERYQALAKVAELGSFTRAAEIMGYTQPAMSQMIASLERELGFKLLYRSRYGVRLTPEGERVELGVDELAMGYRTSRVKTDGLIVLSATFELEKADEEGIRAKMDDLTRQREEKQPLELPSAGSTFKRPEGHFAGKLIMDAGLKGYQVGGAAVSEKHAGFVVNVGGATAADVHAVIEHVQAEVLRQFGVALEPEVLFLG